MTVDHLVKKLNDGWGYASFDVSMHGDGKWTAKISGVTVFGKKGEELAQIQPKTFLPRNAAAELIEWLRGKKICLRGMNGGADGPRFRIPKTLKVPIVR